MIFAGDSTVAEIDKAYVLKIFLLKFVYSEKATKFLRNLHRRFDHYYIRQIYGGDFGKICGLLRIYELYSTTEVMPTQQVTGVYWNYRDSSKRCDGCAIVFFCPGRTGTKF